MKGIITLTSVIVALGTLCASAALVTSESFEYPADDLNDQNGGFGWGGAWSSPAGGQVTSNSLPVVGYDTVGNKMSLAGGTTVTRPVDNWTGTVGLNINATNYFSVLVNKPDGGTSSAEDLKMWINLASGTLGGFEYASHEKMRVNIRGGATVESAVALSDETHLLVMKLVTFASGSSNTLSMTWFNAGEPLPASESEVTWRLTASTDNHVGYAPTTLQFSQGAAVDSMVDEIKMGSELIDVIPDWVSTLVTSEPFEYPEGGLSGQNGGSGWGGSWSSPAGGQVASNSLPVIGYNTTGNKMSLAGGTMVTRPIDNWTGVVGLNVDATTYYSMLIDKPDSGTNITENLVMWINLASGQLGGFQYGSDEKMSLMIRGGATVSTTAALSDETHLLLMKLVTTASGSSNTLSMTWFSASDPMPAGESEVVWHLTASTANHVGYAPTTLQFNQGDSVDSLVDEFRMGRQLFDVIPEAEFGYGRWSKTWGVDIGVETNDFDGDGVVNVSEYALAGDPTDDHDRGVSSEIGTYPGDNVLSYIHPQLSDTNSGLTYSFELNPDLAGGVWTNLGYTVAGTNVTSGNLDFVTNVVDAAGDEMFIRLNIGY